MNWVQYAMIQSKNWVSYKNSPTICSRKSMEDHQSRPKTYWMLMFLALRGVGVSPPLAFLLNMGVMLPTPDTSVNYMFLFRSFQGLGASPQNVGAPLFMAMCHAYLLPWVFMPWIASVFNIGSLNADGNGISIIHEDPAYLCGFSHWSAQWSGISMDFLLACLPGAPV